MDTGFGISCKCGHHDDYDCFEVDQWGHPLPAGHYRCPVCGSEWQLLATGPAQILDNGLEIPAPRQVVEL